MFKPCPEALAKRRPAPEEYGFPCTRPKVANRTCHRIVLILGPFLVLTAPRATADLNTAGVRPASGAGVRHPSERSVYRDPETGRDVVRLTDSAAEDIKIYQTHPSWTTDGEWIVFHSNRTGTAQLFAVHERLGTIVQLTDEPGVNVGQVCLSRRRPELLTVVGDEIVRVDVRPALVSDAVGSTGAAPGRQVMGRIPEGAQLSGTMSWGAEETFLYVGLKQAAQPESAAYSITRLDLERGVWTTVIKPGFQVGHVQANPWIDDLLMYCHETGGDAPQRMWVVQADGSSHRPFYRETFGEWVTHEVWWNATSALFTVWPKDETLQRKPHGIASISLEGPVRFHSRFPYWHVTGAAGCPYAVADTFDGQIVRVHLETGERLVLTAGHRVERKGAHPHPTLDPAGAKVLFNSNLGGQADLCLVELSGESDRAEHRYRTRRYTRRSATAARGWQRELRAELAALLKLDDLVGEPLPLNPRVLTTIDEAAFNVREIEIDSTPSRRMVVRLCRPTRAAARVPGVVCIHGHGGNRSSVYDTNSVYKGFAQALSRGGWVTVAANVGQHEIFEPGRTLLGERLWDLMRCVDYLCTLPEVDPTRIGCAGLSLGGEMAMWLGAMEPRVRATVSSGFLTTMDQMEQNHCLCWKLEGLRELVDYADIYALIAPRALQCQNGLREGPTDFWVPLAQGAIEQIRDIYQDLGYAQNVQLLVHEGGHEIELTSLIAFLERTLGP